jgi:hypothetical protein
MNSKMLESLEIDHVRNYLSQLGWSIEKANDAREIWAAHSCLFGDLMISCPWPQN